MSPRDQYWDAVHRGFIIAIIILWQRPAASDGRQLGRYRSFVTAHVRERPVAGAARAGKAGGGRTGRVGRLTVGPDRKSRCQILMTRRKKNPSKDTREETQNPTSGMKGNEKGAKAGAEGEESSHPTSPC